MTERKYPQRTCIGCRSVRDKKELIRIVHTPDGTFHVDGSGKAKGRGAYLCQKQECLETSLRKGTLSHAFHCPIPAEAVQQIREELEQFVE